jgi:hypothetical protein
LEKELEEIAYGRRDVVVWVEDERRVIDKMNYFNYKRR